MLSAVILARKTFDHRAQRGLVEASALDMREIEHRGDAREDPARGLRNLQPDRLQRSTDDRAIHRVDRLSADQWENVILKTFDPVLLPPIVTSFGKGVMAFLAACSNVGID